MTLRLPCETEMSWVAVRRGARGRRARGAGFGRGCWALVRPRAPPPTLKIFTICRRSWKLRTTLGEYSENLWFPCFGVAKCAKQNTERSQEPRVSVGLGLIWGKLGALRLEPL